MIIGAWTLLILTSKVKQDYADSYGYLTDGSAKPNVYRAGVKFKKDKLLVDLTMKAATGQAYTLYW